ncbi:MAG: hypothetical protein Q9174_004936 [Haloplaca sp. 1 TL-2023]
MKSLDISARSLRLQISQTEALLINLRLRLENVEEEQQKLARREIDLAAHSQATPHSDTATTSTPQVTWTSSSSEPSVQQSSNPSDKSWKSPLAAEEYKRYGRQMILPQVGIRGQLNFVNASVLIVGLGGLGCPAAAYLAGAGVGKLGLIDGDTVEISNLHRQVIHSTSTLGLYKVDSALRYLHELNPLVQYKSYPKHLDSKSALDLFKKYDLILDCTDRPESRYLISDAAVVANKPLISASALGLEGQLLVLNDATYQKGTQPRRFCYRCVFPKPPPAQSVLSCSEGGILGPVVGVMGVLMACEALKLLVRHTYRHYHGVIPDAPQSANDIGGPPDQPSMLLYSATSNPMFRTVKIKGRRPDCPLCTTQTITKKTLLSGLDYGLFCNNTSSPDHDRPCHSAPPDYFLRRRSESSPGCIILVDVRPRTEFDLAHIEGSINTPYQTLCKGDFGDQLDEAIQRAKSNRRWDAHQDGDGNPPHHKVPYVFTICRRGNDSRKAVGMLQERFPETEISTISGGFNAWRRDIDPSFPDY